MIISRFDAQQPDPRHSFITRHRVWLAAVIAGVAVLMAFVGQTAPPESVPRSTTMAATPTATEDFQYFPALYQNQAKQIEEPIPTF
jgi:hypothetical protein